MRIDFDVKKILTLTLPLQERQRVRVSWLFDLLKIIRDIQRDFELVRDAAFLEATRNGQTIVLEYHLRNLFDDRIRIINEDIRAFVSFGFEAPSFQNDADGRESPSIRNPTGRESPGQLGSGGFVVQIPPSVLPLIDQLEAVIATYEMNRSRYTIQVL